MKADKVATVLMYATGLIGIWTVFTGNFIAGIVMILLSFVLFKIKGKAGTSENSLYAKSCKAEGKTIAELYDLIKDMDTSLGKPWIGAHVGYSGDSIIFGPGKYRDYIVISMNEQQHKFSLKLFDDFSRIRAINPADDSKLDESNYADLDDVNPRSFAEFAAMKVSGSTLVDCLLDMTKKFIAGEVTECPAEFGKYELYYYNSSEGYVKDMDGSEYMTLEGEVKPFYAKVFDAEGELLTSITPKQLDKKDRVVEASGFNMYSEDELYAEIYRKTTIERDYFEIDSEDGTFFADSFFAVERAHIKSNFVIRKDGEVKAIIAGNRHLKFKDEGVCKQYLVLSFDDDYLVLYTSLVNLIMTLNYYVK